MAVSKILSLLSQSFFSLALYIHSKIYSNQQYAAELPKGVSSHLSSLPTYFSLFSTSLVLQHEDT